jgi:hypothetical protein
MRADLGWLPHHFFDASRFVNDALKNLCHSVIVKGSSIGPACSVQDLTLALRIAEWRCVTSLERSDLDSQLCSPVEQAKQLAINSIDLVPPLFYGCAHRYVAIVGSEGPVKRVTARVTCENGEPIAGRH